MLYTTATSLQDAETAALAERGYQDTTKMIMHADRILPKIVVEELDENEALMPVDVQDQTRVMVKNAWNREASASA